MALEEGEERNRELNAQIDELSAKLQTVEDERDAEAK